MQRGDQALHMRIALCPADLGQTGLLAVRQALQLRRLLAQRTRSLNAGATGKISGKRFGAYGRRFLRRL